jgi:DNA processing protein
LALTGGVGWTLTTRLVERFGDLSEALAASEAALRSVVGIGPATAGLIRRIDLTRVAVTLDSLAQDGVSMAAWPDADYPAAFHALPDKPLAVFWRGCLPLPGQPCIAIVGTRTPSRNAARLAHDWALMFASRGWAVVSGLARGVDTCAHQGALAANGATLAVLGGGVNRIYPPENAELARQIMHRGGLISEFHPDSNVARETLVFRNRLIGALARATIVIEAGGDSGALHAARRAHALGRPVFAPGNSEGNRAILADFARLLPEDPAHIDSLMREISQLC